MKGLNLDIIKNYLAKQPIVRAWLFGSFARGEQRADSDVDLLVEFDKSAKVGLLKHATIQLGLEDVLCRQVDLVPSNALYPEVREYVDRDKILIYERGN